MDTITAPENPDSSIASGCVPGASRVVLYKFGQIDMVCTLVQVFLVRTSKTTRSEALFHTTCFLSVTHFMAWREVQQNTGNTFSTQKTKRKIIVLPVVKLRHAKVVVGRQYPRKKPVKDMHSSRYRIRFLLCSSVEKTPQKNRSIDGALLLLWSLTPLL